jgi:hypothetical protein
MSNVTVFGIPARHRREGGGADPCCVKRRPLLQQGEDNRHAANRGEKQYSYRLSIPWLLAGGIGLMSATQAIGSPICRPALSVKEVKFSAMQPPTLERRWTAIVAADASRCATTAGYFEIGFSRLKESGIEIEFREQFIWSTPTVTVSVDFWADEAVESYWIDSIQACPCAK